VALEIFRRYKNSPVKAPRIIMTGILQPGGGEKKAISLYGLLIAVAFYRSWIIHNLPSGALPGKVM
jgi:hypothetical protein